MSRNRALALYLTILFSPVAFFVYSALAQQCNPCDPNPCDPDAVASVTPSVGAAVHGCVDGVHAYYTDGGVANLGTGPLPGYVSEACRNHPMWTQNVYRLYNDRFEQKGMSWVKHDGWDTEVSRPTNCDVDCPCPPSCTVDSVLDAGCHDTYGVCLNAPQNRLGPRSQINPATGLWPVGGWPPAYCSPGGSKIACRLQVKTADLVTGGGYFLEQHVISPDEPSSARTNNVSYQTATVGTGTASLCDPATECGAKRPCEGTGCTNLYPLTVEHDIESCEEPAIRAWKANYPSVVETDIQVPPDPGPPIVNDGLFILAAKATAIGSGWWEYEYALYNMNSDRSAKAFRVALPTDMCEEELQDIRNTAGFHDLDYHSGEVWDGTDWMPPTVVSGSITWATTPYIMNPNANALRWGTLYNFRFQVQRPPANPAAVATIDLFKPGTPSYVTGVSVAPGEPPLRACCIGGTCIVTTPCDCYALGGEVYPSNKCLGVNCVFLAPEPGP